MKLMSVSCASAMLVGLVALGSPATAQSIPTPKVEPYGSRGYSVSIGDSLPNAAYPWNVEYEWVLRKGDTVVDTDTRDTENSYWVRLSEPGKYTVTRTLKQTFWRSQMTWREFTEYSDDEIPAGWVCHPGGILPGWGTINRPGLETDSFILTQEASCSDGITVYETTVSYESLDQVLDAGDTTVYRRNDMRLTTAKVVRGQPETRAFTVKARKQPKPKPKPKVSSGQVARQVSKRLEDKPGLRRRVCSAYTSDSSTGLPTAAIDLMARPFTIGGVYSPAVTIGVLKALNRACF